MRSSKPTQGSSLSTGAPRAGRSAAWPHRPRSASTPSGGPPASSGGCGVARSARSASRRVRSTLRFDTSHLDLDPRVLGEKRPQQRQQQVGRQQFAGGDADRAFEPRVGAADRALGAERGALHVGGGARHRLALRVGRPAAARRARTAVTPSWRSACSMRRNTVEWRSSSARAAPARLPARATASTVRRSSQSERRARAAVRSCKLGLLILRISLRQSAAYRAHRRCRIGDATKPNGRNTMTPQALRRQDHPRHRRHQRHRPGHRQAPGARRRARHRHRLARRVDRARPRRRSASAAHYVLNDAGDARRRRRRSPKR